MKPAIDVWANFLMNEKLTIERTGELRLLDLAKACAEKGYPEISMHKLKLKSRELLVNVAMDMGFDLTALKTSSGKMAMGRGLLDAWNKVYAQRFGSIVGTAGELWSWCLNSSGQNQGNKVKYVSIDLETTGIDPNRCGILEFAAVIADSQTGSLLGQFHRIIKPGPVLWDEYARGLNEKWWLQAMIDPGQCTIPVQYLLVQFQDWLKANKVHFQGITAAGKNFSEFDLQFLNRLIGYGEVISFKSRYLDPGILYFDPAKDDEVPGTETCILRAGLTAPLTHRALDDAKMIVKLLNIAWSKRR